MAQLDSLREDSLDLLNTVSDDDAPLIEFSEADDLTKEGDNEKPEGSVEALDDDDKKTINFIKEKFFINWAPAGGINGSEWIIGEVDIKKTGLWLYCAKFDYKFAEWCTKSVQIDFRKDYVWNRTLVFYRQCKIWDDEYSMKDLKKPIEIDKSTHLHYDIFTVWNGKRQDFCIKYDEYATKEKIKEVIRGATIQSSKEFEDDKDKLEELYRNPLFGLTLLNPNNPILWKEVYEEGDDWYYRTLFYKTGTKKKDVTKVYFTKNWEFDFEKTKQNSNNWTVNIMDENLKYSIDEQWNFSLDEDSKNALINKVKKEVDSLISILDHVKWANNSLFTSLNKVSRLWGNHIDTKFIHLDPVLWIYKIDLNARKEVLVWEKNVKAKDLVDWVPKWWTVEFKDWKWVKTDEEWEVEVTLVVKDAWGKVVREIKEKVSIVKEKTKLKQLYCKFEGDNFVLTDETGRKVDALYYNFDNSDNTRKSTNYYEIFYESNELKVDKLADKMENPVDMLPVYEWDAKWSNVLNNGSNLTKYESQSLEYTDAQWNLISKMPCHKEDDWSYEINETYSTNLDILKLYHYSWFRNITNDIKNLANKVWLVDVQLIDIFKDSLIRNEVKFTQQLVEVTEPGGDSVYCTLGKGKWTFKIEKDTVLYWKGKEKWILEKCLDFMKTRLVLAEQINSATIKWKNGDTYEEFQEFAVWEFWLWKEIIDPIQLEKFVSWEIDEVSVKISWWWNQDRTVIYTAKWDKLTSRLGSWGEVWVIFLDPVTYDIRTATDRDISSTSKIKDDKKKIKVGDIIADPREKKIKKKN